MEVHGFNELGSIDATIEGVRVTVPDDMGNRHRQMIAEWEALGNTIPHYEPPQINLTAYVAQKRWEKETGGIEVNGQIIDTSRESQSMITGAYAYSQANPSETIQFKAASGWVTLDAPTMAAIATAVGAHVQACFALEASVAAAITDGTITTTAEIDAAFG